MATIPGRFLQLLAEPWRAQPDDTAGGWCVTLDEDPRSPGSGALAIAMFLSREVAEHIAAVHNASLVGGADQVAPPAVPPQKDRSASVGLG